MVLLSDGPEVREFMQAARIFAGGLVKAIPVILAACAVTPPPLTSYIPDLTSKPFAEQRREEIILADCQQRYQPRQVGMAVGPAGAAGSAIGFGFAPPESLLGGVAASNDLRVRMEAEAREAAGRQQVDCARRQGVAAVAPAQPEQRLLPKLPYIGVETPDTTIVTRYSNGAATITHSSGGTYIPGGNSAGYDTAPILVGRPGGQFYFIPAGSALP